MNALVKHDMRLGNTQSIDSCHWSQKVTLDTPTTATAEPRLDEEDETGTSMSLSIVDCFTHWRFDQKSASVPAQLPALLCSQRENAMRPLKVSVKNTFIDLETPGEEELEEDSDEPARRRTTRITTAPARLLNMGPLFNDGCNERPQENSIVSSTEEDLFVSTPVTARFCDTNNSPGQFFPSADALTTPVSSSSAAASSLSSMLPAPAFAPAASPFDGGLTLRIPLEMVPGLATMPQEMLSRARVIVRSVCAGAIDLQVQLSPPSATDFHGFQAVIPWPMAMPPQSGSSGKAARPKNTEKRQDASSGDSNMVCCHWKNKGWCKFQASCKFAHPEHKMGVGSSRAKGARVTQ